MLYSVAYECYQNLLVEKKLEQEREEPMSLSATADGPGSHLLQKETQLPAYIFSPAYLKENMDNFFYI